MLKIDLDYAKFVYEMVMLGDLYELGMTDIGWPKGCEYSYKKLWAGE